MKLEKRTFDMGGGNLLTKNSSLLTYLNLEKNSRFFRVQERENL